MKILLSQESVSNDPQLLSAFLALVDQDAQFLRASYPKFDEWLKRKVMPGIVSGERTVLIEYRENEPVGLLILKHTAQERKLCTLRVRPHHESRGLGIRLFESAFEMLETTRPLLSVSAPSMPKFERLFRYFGFEQEAVYSGRYLPMVHELSFNGLLEASEMNSNCCNPAASLQQYQLPRRSHRNQSLAQIEFA